MCPFSNSCCDVLYIKVGAHCASAPTENVRAENPKEVNTNVLLLKK